MHTTKCFRSIAALFIFPRCLSFCWRGVCSDIVGNHHVVIVFCISRLVVVQQFHEFKRPNQM